MSKRTNILAGAILFALAGFGTNGYAQTCFGLPMFENNHVLYGNVTNTDGAIPQAAHLRAQAEVAADKYRISRTTLVEGMGFPDGSRVLTAGIATRQLSPLVLGGRIDIATFPENDNNSFTVGVDFGFDGLRNLLPVEVCPRVGYSFSRLEYYHGGYDMTQTYMVVPISIGIGKHFPLPQVHEDLGILPYVAPQVFWTRSRVATTIRDDLGNRAILKDDYTEYGAEMGATVTWGDLFLGFAVIFNGIEGADAMTALRIGMRN